MRTMFAAALAVLSFSSAADAGVITGTVTANYVSTAPGGILANLSDGITPADYTTYATYGKTVWWNASSTSFTVDFGDLYDITSGLLSVDHNDDYHVSYSLDGITFTSLFSVLRTEGTVNHGLQAFTKTFSEVTARYLRVSASGGDSAYGIGELHAIGSRHVDVPEPAAVGLLGLGLVGAAALRRRKARA